MSQKPTFGVSIPHRLAMRPSGDFDIDSYADMVVEAERLGYHRIMVADHIFVPAYWAALIGDVFFEPFTLLSYLAARTSQIKLTLACLVVPYRQPFATAKMVAAIDQLSRGRFALGVVPGYLKDEFRTFNLVREERGQMTEEFVRIMVELWTNDQASYRGAYYSCEDVSIKPRCVQNPHVPIWVGGSSRNAMRRVVEFGDVWYPLGFEPVSEAYMKAHEEEFTNSMQTGGTTPDRLRDGLDYIFQLAERTSRDLTGLGVVVNLGAQDMADMNRADAPAARCAEQVIDWLGRYLESGATGFSIRALGSSPGECIEYLAQFADEVIKQT